MLVDLLGESTESTEEKSHEYPGCGFNLWGYNSSQYKEMFGDVARNAIHSMLILSYKRECTKRGLVWTEYEGKCRT